MNRKKYIYLTGIVLFANIVVDRLAKLAAAAFLKGTPEKSFLADIIRISYIENKGAFLGMGADWPVFLKIIILVIIPAAACLYGIYYCSIKADNNKKIILLSIIIGGGIGNLIDRIIFNFRVIDFLNLGIGPVIRTAYLNIADLSIAFGAALFLIFEFRRNKQKNLQTSE